MLDWLFTYSEQDLKSRREDQVKFHKLGDDRVAESEMLRQQYLAKVKAYRQPKIFFGQVRWETKKALGFKLWKHNQTRYNYTFHHTKANTLQSILDIIDKN